MTPTIRLYTRSGQQNKETKIEIHTITTVLNLALTSDVRIVLVQLRGLDTAGNRQPVRGAILAASSAVSVFEGGPGPWLHSLLHGALGLLWHRCSFSGWRGDGTFKLALDDVLYTLCSTTYGALHPLSHPRQFERIRLQRTGSREQQGLNKMGWILPSGS